MEASVSSSPFRRYVRELRCLTTASVSAGGLSLAHVDLAQAHLNGRVGRELRSAVQLSELRRIGAFFTGERLANQVVRHALDQGSSLGAVLDHACGCGDLLIATARQLPMLPDLESTLREWGTVLHGVERVPEFVEVARERLLLLALTRGARVAEGDLLPLAELLPNIVIGDGRDHPFVRCADTVVLNPPYGLVTTPADIDWASGLVTDAALWTARTSASMKEQAILIAVLPDVLRSGSRYAKWRAEIADKLDLLEVRSEGQFDTRTDVDVFVLVARRRSSLLRNGWPTARTSEATLGDASSVVVGSVVDLRDPHEGPEVPYITTRDLPQSGEAYATRTRRFSGRLVRPPFVVVRRTSRPTITEPRLRPVIIRGSRPVAIENHLIILKPAKATLANCRTLSELLKTQAVTDFLNHRIRTRHLTVSSVREIPVGVGALDGQSRRTGRS